MIYDRYNKRIFKSEKQYQEKVERIKEIIKDGEKQHEMAILTLNKIKATIN